MFIHSSNVASVKIIDLIGIEEQQNLFRKIGLVENPKINGLNIVSNKAPKIWNETSSKFISYGYGISLSPISLVSAFSTLVNGGFKISPKIFKEESYISEEKVLFTTTSKKINNLLKEIVKKGTGRKANVNGLELGGKTGTSKKVEKGKYSEKKSYYIFYWSFSNRRPKLYYFCSL